MKIELIFFKRTYGSQIHVIENDFWERKRKKKSLFLIGFTLHICTHEYTHSLVACSRLMGAILKVRKIQFNSQCKDFLFFFIN